MLTANQLIARRIGRITFGGVLIVGVAYLTVAAASSPLGLRFHQQASAELPIGAAQIIPATWIAAVILGALARGIAARLPLRQPPDALFSESIMAPTVGIALLLPITLHLPIALLVADSEAFDFWVQASLWITGLAHTVFAITSAVRGHQLVAGKPAWSPRRIYLLTVVTSGVPFVILWAIPPILVAITALPFLPMLHRMERLVADERAASAALPRVLPRAVAVVPRRPA